MWVLAGRNDVKFLAHILPRIADYSDEGRIFHGAYGYRMRQHFGFDQIEETVTLLKQTPSTRQAVISIWDANADLGAETKDMPCNDLIDAQGTARPAEHHGVQPQQRRDLGLLRGERGTVLDVADVCGRSP